MTEVMLVGGPEWCDGTRREIDSPWCHRPIELGGHFYILTSFNTGTKTWWLAIEESMDLDSAIESIFWRYP